jgi:peptidoglycan/LPS O-acetylase OafA/YrhL
MANSVFVLLTLATAIILLSGVPAFVQFFTSQDAIPDSKLVALTPAATFFLIIGVTGTLLIVLCGRNLKTNTKLAQKQFIVGWAFIFLCYTCMDVLLKYGYT